MNILQKNLFQLLTEIDIICKEHDIKYFLAGGNAGVGLIDICRQAGANVVGFAAAVEKLFQGGREKIEALGVKVYSGAAIKSIENNTIIFG